MEVKSLSLLTKKYNIPKFAKWLALFLLYFLICFLALYIANGAFVLNRIFSSDSYRVTMDWTSFGFDHDRTEVHPLYVLINYPIISLLSLFSFGDKILAIVLYISFLATLNSYLLWKILSKYSLKCSNFLFVLTVLFYSFSFSQLTNVMTVDSFLVGTTTLLIFWCYFTYVYGKEIELKNIIVLSLLGILCISMTTTNYFQFALGLAILLVFKKQKNLKSFLINCLKFALIIAVSLGVSYLLMVLQQKIFVSANNGISYFYEYLKWFLFKVGRGVVDDTYFTRQSIDFTGIARVVKAFLGMTFISGKHVKGLDYSGAYYIKRNFLVYAMIFIMAALLCCSLFICMKKKKYIVLPYFLVWVSQCVFHLFYGNSEAMLYALHSSFLLVISIFIGLAEIDPGRLKKTKKLYYAFGIIFVVVTLFANFYSIGVLYKRLVDEFSYYGGASAFNTLVLVFNVIFISAFVWLYSKIVENNLNWHALHKKRFDLYFIFMTVVGFVGLIAMLCI